MKSYQLHTAEDRRVAYAGLPGIWLETELFKRWIVVAPELLLTVLHSPSVAVLDTMDLLAAIEASHGLRFPNVAFACGALPLMVPDNQHGEARRRCATFLADRLAELEPQLPAMAKDCMAPLAQPGKVDIVADMMQPFMQRLVSILLQCDMPADLIWLRIGEVVSFSASIGRLKKLDADIGKTLEFLRATSVCEHDLPWRLTVLAFGVDSLAMMICESIVTAIRASDGSGAKLPAFPVETGVPVTYRRAKQDLDVGGCHIEAGDMIRLQLQTFGYSDLAEEQKFIFGAGAHSCIGKQMSLRIWHHLKAEFDRLDVKARITRYELSPSHFLANHHRVVLDIR